MTHSINSTEFEVYYANATNAGYGHKRIEVELYCKGICQKFWSVTTNMPGFDDADDLTGSERFEALYELIANDIEEQVAEWIETINE